MLQIKLMRIAGNDRSSIVKCGPVRPLLGLKGPWMSTYSKSRNNLRRQLMLTSKTVYCAHGPRIVVLILGPA